MNPFLAVLIVLVSVVIIGALVTLCLNLRYGKPKHMTAAQGGQVLKARSDDRAPLKV